MSVHLLENQLRIDFEQRFHETAQSKNTLLEWERKAFATADWECA